MPTADICQMSPTKSTVEIKRVKSYMISYIIYMKSMGLLLSLELTGNAYNNFIVPNGKMRYLVHRKGVNI